MIAIISYDWHFVTVEELKIRITHYVQKFWFIDHIPTEDITDSAYPLLLLPSNLMFIYFFLLCKST